MRWREVDGELVVTGDDAGDILELVEGRLDAPALAIAAFVVPDRALAVAPARDDRFGAGLAQILEEEAGS